MNAPKKHEIFSPDEKENAGIAALCRGFLTMYDGKRAALLGVAHKSVVTKEKKGGTT